METNTRSNLTDITRTFTQVKEPWSRRFMRYAGILTVFACILTFMLLTRGNGLHAPSGDLQVQEASMNFSLPAKTQEPPKPEVYRKKISEIRIGEKSVGHNPQGIEASEADSEIFQKVKHNGYTLLYLKENQTLSVIELLRPENWLDAENIQIRRASDDKVLTEEELNILETAKAFEKDDEDYDLEVWIELPEMGVVGWATLVAIDGEVNIQDGPGNVVTGTFAHISDNVIDLQIEDQDKPIGCTANHPFWSVDRQDFIEAGQLLEGEQVQLYSGETKRVVQKLPRPGPQVVYNLEVYAEHVYHVTQDGVLVHNNCINNAGKRGEEIALKMAGLKKNTRKYVNLGIKRIPDAISPAKYIVEIKNVKYQHLSSQIKDYIDIAANEKRKFVLLINENAKISKQLKKLAESKTIKIIPIPM